MLLVEKFPQLSFEIDNPNEPNTIYITSDPSLNKLVFDITTNTDNTLFTPGQLVDKNSAPQATGSILYIDLRSLKLSSQEFGQLQCAADNWQYKLYPDERLICLTPTKDITLNSGSGNVISIKIVGMTMTNPPIGQSANLNVLYFRVVPSTNGNTALTSFFKVLLQNESTGHADLNKVIACNLLGEPYVCNSLDPAKPVNNNLFFVFQPGTASKVVKAGPKTVFTVSFVYADGIYGYGALTTAEIAANKVIIKQGQNASKWRVKSNSERENPSWSLTPPNEEPIIGSNSKSIVQFDIENIETYFQPGPTLMFVQYNDVPGYNDGSYYILIDKVPHVSIQSFVASPNPAYLGKNDKANVHLQWDVLNAGTLILYPGVINVTGKSSYEEEVKDTTNYVLMAYGKYLSGSGNIDTFPLTETILPKINSFAAQPQNIYYKNFPSEVKFSWNVSTNNTVNLVSSIDGPGAYSFDPVGNVEKSMKWPQMMSLVPKGNPDPSIVRNIVLSAFKIDTANHVIPNTPVLELAMMPSGNILFASNAKANSIYAINTLTYLPIGNPLIVGNLPSCPTISKDGRFLYVANSGNNSVSVIKVTNTSGGFSFTLFTTVENVGQKPCNIAISPLGDEIYVTDNSSAGNNIITVIAKDSNDNFTILTTISIGIGSGYLAVSPSGQYIFAANKGGNNVSVVHRYADETFKVVKIIPVGKAPIGLAVTPNGKYVFACNSSDNTVSIIDITTLSVTSITLQVGNYPIEVVINPSSYYAIVSNYDGATISLIGFNNDSGKYQVLEQNIGIGQKPTGLAIAPSGNQVFIGTDANSNSLATLSLVAYEKIEDVSLQNMAPTNAVASADNKKVLTWKAKASSSDVQGVTVVDAQTYITSQAMVGLSIIDIVYTPDNKYIYVLYNDNGTGKLVKKDAKTYTDIKSIDGLVGIPSKLCINIDGSLLTVSLSKSINGNNAVTIINIAITTPVIIKTVELQAGAIDTSILPMVITSDSKKIFVVQKNSVSVIVLLNGVYTLYGNVIPVGELSSAVGILPDCSKAITVASMDHSISIIDTVTYSVNTIVIPDSYSNYLTGIAVSPDGSNIVVSNTKGATLLVIDTITFNVNYVLDTGQFPEFPIFLSDGSQIFIPNKLGKSLTAVRQIQPVLETNKKKTKKRLTILN